MDASNADAYYNRGYSRYHLGRYKLAVSGFCDAMALPNRAIEDFTQAISVDPTSGVAYANRALVLVFAGTVEEARADAERAIGLGVELETLITTLKLNIRHK